jgi:serine/threonine protein kinase
MSLNHGESIIQCHDSFDFRNSYWIMLELMDGDLLPVIEYFKGQYDTGEAFIKYVLYRALQSIHFLH